MPASALRSVDTVSPPRAAAGVATRDSAVEIAAGIARGERTAADTVEQAIARIQAENPKLNAVVVERYEAARAEARAVDDRRRAGEVLGPLAGVPITVKECLDLAGTPSTFGLPSRRDHRAAADDPYVAALRSAGAVVVGKTNVAQLLLFVESDNPLYGRTANPHDPERSAGGSSGGEGAMLAAGATALGLGTDIGGSLRVPAAFCGIASLKPTAGRFPDVGRFSVPIGQRAIVSQVGPLANHVDDVALAMRVLAAVENGEREACPPLGDPAAVDVRGLRVAMFDDDGFLRPAPAVRRAVAEAARHLEAAGATVVAWKAPALEEAFAIFYGVLSAGAEAYIETLGRDPRDPRVNDIVMVGTRSRTTRALIEGLARLVGQTSLAGIVRVTGKTNAAGYWSLCDRQRAYRIAFSAALDAAPGGPIDAVISPVCGLPAYRHGAARELGLGGTYTLLNNVLGYPAGVVPVTHVRAGEESDRAPSRDRSVTVARRCEEGSAGLPVGVQVAARPWKEHVALAAMKAIERGVRGA